MADPYAQISAALCTIINTEFDVENYVAVNDRLHESLGWDGTYIGVSPEGWRPRPRDRNSKETLALIQFYDKWEKEIDPAQRVDPTRITGFAARLEAAIQTQQASDPGTESVWFFDVNEVIFPLDPTGNKTRFHMLVRAFGQNNAILETIS